METLKLCLGSVLYCYSKSSLVIAQFDYQTVYSAKNFSNGSDYMTNKWIRHWALQSAKPTVTGLVDQTIATNWQTFTVICVTQFTKMQHKFMYITNCSTLTVVILNESSDSFGVLEPYSS